MNQSQRTLRCVQVGILVAVVALITALCVGRPSLRDFCVGLAAGVLIPTLAVTRSLKSSDSEVDTHPSDLIEMKLQR